ncbi:MAG: hypothetical protein WBG70_01585 [Spirulinaceae cyanobacterium]
MSATAGCSPIKISPSEVFSRSKQAKAATNCVPGSSLAQALETAFRAATLAQSAQSAQDWNTVALNWIQAIEGMQTIPISSPEKTFAQKKVLEYQKNLAVAQQKALAAPTQIPFASFNSQFLDKQLLLYLSYVAAMGTPDVLVVGSSRAVQGVNPRQLESALMRNGQGKLQVFNLGVNGATAQVVDLIIQNILATDQKPRLIIWADGVRAFNDGRVDRTYNGIISSAGYRNVLAGNLPQLPQRPSGKGNVCKEFDNVSSQPKFLRWLSQVDLAQFLPWSTEAAIAAIDVNAIDPNGFLPISFRFDPNTYFQQYPRVAGLYDGDYQNFSLGGQQVEALSRLVAYTRQAGIPLVFVNLPLTQTYLDSTRQNAEQQFVQVMQQKSNQLGFTFVDLGKIWLNQNSYFADPSHLNLYGAAAVSNLLATQERISWPNPSGQGRR